MKGPFRPVCTSVKEPSGWPKNFPGPFSGTVMVFPVCRFVYETVTAPVKRKVVDPSAVLRTLVNSLLTGKATRSLNPQNDAGRVKGGPEGCCHLCPRPARAGEAVTTPPSTHSSAPSATITPSRLMAITSTARPPHVAMHDTGHEDLRTRPAFCAVNFWPCARPAGSLVEVDAPG